MSARLLLVEDEESLARGLVDVLTVKGYTVDQVADGEEALARALQTEYHLILLDATLPGMGGFEVLRELRARQITTRVVMLTARATEMDRVLGFELGVDDYVTKPFSLLELLGRIAALLRRSPTFARESECRFRFGEVQVDLDRFTLTRRGQEVALPAKAFDILRLLLSRPGQVVSRDTILDEVWGVGELVALRTLNNLMAKIRRALEVSPDQPRYLKTIHGVGYRLEVPDGA